MNGTDRDFPCLWGKKNYKKKAGGRGSGRPKYNGARRKKRFNMLCWKNECHRGGIAGSRFQGKIATQKRRKWSERGNQAVSRATPLKRNDPNRGGGKIVNRLLEKGWGGKVRIRGDFGGTGKGEKELVMKFRKDGEALEKARWSEKFFSKKGEQRCYGRVTQIPGAREKKGRRFYRKLKDTCCQTSLAREVKRGTEEGARGGEKLF